MAYLTETSNFDNGVYQLETTDPVAGGPSGISNTPLKNLANRTLYLKNGLDLKANITDIYGGTLTYAQIIAALGFTPSDFAHDTIDLVDKNTTAVSGGVYVLIDNVVLTLPLIPVSGEKVKIINCSGLATCSVNGNSKNIMSINETMTLDVPQTVMLTFIDNLKGWVL